MADYQNYLRKRPSAATTGATRDLDGLVHHIDRGGQYLAIRYTEGLGEQGAVNSVGSKGDSYDNALAETIIGLYKITDGFRKDRQASARPNEHVHARGG